MNVLDRVEKAIQERLSELRGLQARGRKVVAVLAAQAPPFELVEATGCTPVRLLWGGDAALEARGLRYVKNEACSLLKGILGAVSTGVGIVPDAVVVPGTCDQLRRSEEIFSRDLGLRTYALGVPRAHDAPRAAGRMEKELRWLGRELASFSGAKDLDADVLESRVTLWNEARSVLAHVAESSKTGRLGGGEAMALARSISILSPETFLALAEEVLAAAEGKSISRSTPLILAGPPALLGDDLVSRLIEDSDRGRIVGDASETGCFPHLSPVETEGDPLTALAKAANRFPLGCGFKRPDGGFVSAVRRMGGAEGIVYKSLSFCAPWNHQAARFRKIFGLPFLAIEGDYSGGQESRLKTRIEAFIESLEMRRSPAQG
ncbi:MAG: 2-hydroxyacyl-CoA dehydratase subunit D [Planctomycetota bacterium]